MTWIHENAYGIAIWLCACGVVAGIWIAMWTLGRDEP